MEIFPNSQLSAESRWLVQTGRGLFADSLRSYSTEGRVGVVGGLRYR